MSQLVRVLAKFVREDESPLCGGSYHIRLFDEDPLRPDHLGDSQPNDEGSVEFTFNLGKALSLDSPMEQKPDLFLVVYDSDEEIYRTEVFPNVDFLKEDPVSKRQTQLTQDLGLFIVPGQS